MSAIDRETLIYWLWFAVSFAAFLVGGFYTVIIEYGIAEGKDRGDVVLQSKWWLLVYAERIFWLGVFLLGLFFVFNFPEAMK